MKPSDLSPDQLNSLIEKYRNGASAPDLAAEYDLNLATLRDLFYRRGVTQDLGPADSEVSSAEWSEEDYSLQARHDQEKARLLAQLRHTQRLYKAAVQKGTVTDTLVSTLQDLVTAWPAPSHEGVSYPKGRSHGTHTMGLSLSDQHTGEVVSLDAMQGLGEYNLEVFRRRAGRLVKKVVHLMEIERSQLEIPRLTILLDGDVISGLIHDELLKTNEVNVLDQATLAARVTAWVISQLSRHFEEVHVSCTVGNHGRNQKKVEFKEPHLNWDYIAYQLMAMFLKNHDNVTFDIPKSLWSITPIEHLKFLHYHGHGIPSWGGIPYYGLERAVKDIRESLAVGDETFDAVVQGHLHVPFEQMRPGGPFIVNGCWKGGDEFALFGLRKWIPPYQTMFLVSEREGYCGRRLVHLSNETLDDAIGVPESVAPVWADEEV